jgi:hypothetical protein
MSKQVDLRNCKPGDRLRGRQGSILTYVGPTPQGGPTNLAHVVQYVTRPDGTSYPPPSYGTRTDDGYVYMLRRMPDIDEDIVEVLS